MVKVAIVTIESANFGNRLQNYALQQALKMQGCSVQTLHRNEIENNIKDYIKRFIQNVFQTKAAKFRKFDSYIEYSDLIISRDKFPRDLSEKYDYFIVGSDQVWNPYYDFVAGKCDFLDFAMKYQKISYAASFGVNEIPNERKAEYAKYLKEFKAISVREKQGAKIVKELTNRVAMVVLDPTLLLDADDWQKVEHKSNYRPKNKYAFVYALGEKNERFKRKIEQLSKEYNIFDIRAIQKNGKEIPVGPSEFLYLLRNSEIVLTDSFHATAFSIIFYKKFITFNRTGLNMNSRIESLSDLVDERKHMNEHGDWNCENMIDYQKTDAILEEERKKSMEFLRAALSD